MQIRRRHTVQALSDVALSVGHGEVVGLVGESGGGKTMIARSIIAALPRGARWRAGAPRRSRRARAVRDAS